MRTRFPKFDFSSSPAHWTKNPEFAQKANAASLIPAYIEPFLLKVMQRAREKIDPSKKQLLSDIDIFCKQEMQHLRQHRDFNKRMHSLGYAGLIPFERDYEAGYERFLKEKSLRFNLAYCEGFECLSATACELWFEGYSEFLEGADPETADMWRWHLAEEFEHRTVAHEVYHELSGLDPVSQYFYRVYGYIYAVVHLGRFTKKVAQYLLEVDRANMTPEQLQASLAREKAASKTMQQGFLRMALRIASPFYHPAKRREPRGYKEFLADFEVRRSRKPSAASAQPGPVAG